MHAYRPLVLEIVELMMYGNDVNQSINQSYF